MIAMSMTCPRPVGSRARSAVMTANAVVRAVIPSARPNGGSVGGPSGSPVMAANPLIASASVPNPGRFAYGPVWPKPVTRATTRPGLRSWSTLGAEAPALEGAGAEVLDHHVGVAASSRNTSWPSGVREHQRDALLVAAEHLPPQPDAVRAAAVGARGVAARVLDLDHLGAEVAEQRRGQRAREEGGDVEDLQSGECAGLVGRGVRGAGGARHGVVLPAATAADVRRGSAPRRRETRSATATTRGAIAVTNSSVTR